MGNRLTLMALLLMPLATLQAAAAPQAARRPNIVYLLADQWRASAMGYAGDPTVKTPNLDRLPKESLNFRNTVE